MMAVRTASPVTTCRPICGRCTRRSAASSRCPPASTTTRRTRARRRPASPSWRVWRASSRRRRSLRTGGCSWVPWARATTSSRSAWTRRTSVWLFLHSGSRGVGNKLAMKHIGVAQQQCEKRWISLPDRDLAYLVEGDREFWSYMEALRWAQRFAYLNREEMMHRVIDCFEAWAGPIERIDEINCHHNYTVRETPLRQGRVAVPQGRHRRGRRRPWADPWLHGRQVLRGDRQGQPAGLELLTARCRPQPLAVGGEAIVHARGPGRAHGRHRVGSVGRLPGRAPGRLQGHRCRDARCGATWSASTTPHSHRIRAPPDPPKWALWGPDSSSKTSPRRASGYDGSVCGGRAS